MKIRPWSGYPISPEDIRTDEQFINTFGTWEAEEVARAIVRYCQYQDAWSPFIMADLGKFFGTRSGKDWLIENLRAIASNAISKGLQNLLELFYLEKDEEDEGVYYVNELFIDRCYSAYPISRKV